MNSPTKPIKPLKPTAPVFSKTVNKDLLYNRGVCLKTILEELPVGIDHSTVEVTTSGYGGDYDDLEISIEWKEEVIDPDYEEKAAAFKNKLVSYDAAMETFNARQQQYLIDKKKYDDDTRAREIETLEARLNLLRSQ